MPTLEQKLKLAAEPCMMGKIKLGNHPGEFYWDETREDVTDREWSFIVDEVIRSRTRIDRQRYALTLKCNMQQQSLIESLLTATLNQKLEALYGN